MSPRPAPEPIITVRASARVSRVAELLDCDESDVRRMLRRGELEGHVKGVRGIRIYLDSVAAYQESRPLRAHRPRPHKPGKSQRSAVSRAASLAAEMELRKSGILP